MHGWTAVEHCLDLCAATRAHLKLTHLLPATPFTPNCCSLAPLEPVHLSPQPRGSLSNLASVTVEGLEAPASGQVALAVRAVGLNFR